MPADSGGSSASRSWVGYRNTIYLTGRYYRSVAYILENIVPSLDGLQLVSLNNIAEIYESH